MTQDEWYLLQEGQSRGPLGTNEVQALRARSELSDSTLIWQMGQDKWKPVSEVLPKIGPIPPPLPQAFNEQQKTPDVLLKEVPVRASMAPTVGNAEWQDTSPHPWRRYFARMLDTLVHGSLGFFVIGIVAVVLGPSGSAILKALEDINPTVSAVAATLLAIPFNALLIGLTGGSLGKWLFGVKVLDRNQPIGFGPALLREGSVWLRGLGLGIPFISLFTLIASFRTLQKAGATSWDASEGYTVTHRPKGNRLVIGMLVGIGLYLLVLAGLIALGSK
jgi:uncharacterized RDD family membrane protein YckC